MNFVGYIRVSRKGDRGGDSYITKDVQRERIEGWAKVRGYTVGHWFVDEDVTGGTMHRPGLDEALELVRAKQADGIVVAYVDRFSRAGVGDALNVAEEIYELGGNLGLVDLDIDTTTPVGEMVFTNMLAIARMRRREIKASWAVAQARAVERGVHIGPTPVGYRRTMVNAQGKPSGPLEPDPVTAPIVRHLFEMRATGATWSDLARYLTDHVPTRYGTWAVGTMHNIIGNRVYLGEIACGEARNPAAHEPLVTPGLFTDANRARGVRPTAKHEWLLSGLVRCCGCRYMLRGQGAPPARKGDPKRRSYCCRGSLYAKSEQCENPAHIIAEQLEAWVLEQAFARHEGDLVRAVEATGDLPGAERAVEEQRERVEGLYGLQANAKRPELAAGAIAEAEVELERLEGTRDELRAARAAGPAGVFSLRDLWEGWTLDEKRGALSQMMHCVVVRKHGQGRWSDVPVEERAVILWKADGATPEFPHRGRIAPGATTVGGTPLDWEELKARAAAAHH